MAVSVLDPFLALGTVLAIRAVLSSFASGRG